MNEYLNSFNQNKFFNQEEAFTFLSDVVKDVSVTEAIWDKYNRQYIYRIFTNNAEIKYISSEFKDEEILSWRREIWDKDRKYSLLVFWKKNDKAFTLVFTDDVDKIDCDFNQIEPEMAYLRMALTLDLIK